MTWAWHWTSQVCVSTYKVEWIILILFIEDQIRVLYAARCHVNLRWHYYYQWALEGFTCISYTKFSSLPRPEGTFLWYNAVSDPQVGKWLPECAVSSSPRLNVLCGWRCFSRDGQKQNLLLVWTQLDTYYNVTGLRDPVSSQMACQPISGPVTLRSKVNSTTDLTLQEQLD